MTPYFMQNVVYEWVIFFQKFYKIQMSQYWLKLKKIWTKSGNFGQNLAQNWADW